ncbi:MAG: hypothetical protein JSW67_14345 [Candidatus Latescibacterota bacterium]|nr:MAG: hypothetical protein JSW67_14345 [Candidatus Latescibacterota bacterium]
MRGTCLDIAHISRYVQNLAELEEIVQLEQHVERCARCRDRLGRVKRHSESLFEEFGSAEPGPRNACPTSIQLQHFRKRGLSERQMIRVQEHLRACDDCRRHVFAEAEARSMRLLATRAPDLDLRVAALGIHIVSGADLLDLGVAPTLVQRLDLNDLASSRRAVTAARQLHFRVRGASWELRGKIEIVGLDGFRLDVRLEEGAPPGAKLELWCRERIHTRFTAGVDGWRFAQLLAPGHYFVGPSADAAAWLALSVEWDFLTPRGLAECAYDLCCRGRFHAALRCLDEAVALSPATAAYADMRRCVHDFAARFGLATRDREIRWTHPPRPRFAAPAVPESVDMQSSATDVDRIVELVHALRSRSEAAELNAHDVEDACILSRRDFRTPYHDLLIALHAVLARPESSLADTR